MTSAVQIIFWVSASIIIYTYAGYPILLFLLTRIKNALKPRLRSSMSQHQLPALTLVVTSYNEAEILSEKISNTLALSYPADKFRIIFVTDGSNDGSPSIVARHDRIELLHQPERRGKLAAMNRAMQFVNTDIVVFSDANTLINSDALTRIVPHYSDPRIGAVSGEKKISQVGNGEAIAGGEGLYWKYESLIKRMDSDLKTIVGAAGELFSVRRDLYSFLPEDIILEDFVQSLKVCEKGFLVRYEPEAYTFEKASSSLSDEVERKTRICAGAFQAMPVVKNLYNFFRYPIIAFQLISHRLLRWTLAPLSLPVLMAASAYLVVTDTSSAQETPSVYEIALVVQLVAYLCGLAGWWQAARGGKKSVFFPAFYFLLMNYCVYAGFLRFFRRKQNVLWEKAPRG